MDPERRVFFLAALLAFEAQNRRAGVLATKTPLPISFVVTAWIQVTPPTAPYYARLLLVGLIFCLGGGVLLLAGLFACPQGLKRKAKRSFRTEG